MMYVKAQIKERLAAADRIKRLALVGADGLLRTAKRQHNPKKNLTTKQAG